MPYVNIRVAGTLTTAQKATISKGVTEVISQAAGQTARISAHLHR